MCSFHPEELKNPQYKIELDIDWYLRHQIHPPLMRLLTPVNGIDAGKIAECLGMDGMGFGTCGTLEGRRS
jgi:DNA polymerase alpha subunit A